MILSKHRPRAAIWDSGGQVHQPQAILAKFKQVRVHSDRPSVYWVVKSLSWDDEEVVRGLYAGSIGEATRLAYLVVGDHHAAEDLAHDAFVRVASRLGALRNSGAFSAYLRRTVVNLSVSKLRRNRIEERALSLWSNSAVGSSPMDDASTREGLRMAIQALPARQKAAIVLHFYLDLSETQTAEVLDCSRGAAKSLISRGLGRLRVDVSKGEWQDALP